MRAHLCLCGFPVLMGGRAFLRSGRLMLQAVMARAGRRPHMEDFHVMWEQTAAEGTAPSGALAVFGVLDGHCGKGSAEWW